MDVARQPQSCDRVYDALLVGGRFCKLLCSIQGTFLQTESAADYALDRAATVLLFITQLGKQSPAGPTASSCLEGHVCDFSMLLLLDTPSQISVGTPYASDSYPTHGVVFVTLFGGRVL